jgi:hypothetical protein
MTDSTRFLIGAIVMLLPLFVATYFRGLATEAFRQAKAFAPQSDAAAAPTAVARFIAFFMSVNRGGGPEFFWTPEWMAMIANQQGRQHVANFKRHRRMFWLFMASLPGWFVLVSRLFWK